MAVFRRIPIFCSLFAMLGASLLAPAALAHARSDAPDGAQKSPQNTPKSTGEIVVSGTGLKDTPSAIAYASEDIPRAQIIGAPSGRIEDVLSNIAGFQQFRRSDSRSANPSAQGVTLRSLGGNATSRALVALDGVPIADPFFGYIPLSAFDPEQLARIKVTRGGGSGPFGAGALAGTIALESADARALGRVNASTLINDRGESETSASLAGELGGGFAVIHARRDRGKGFFTAPQSQRVPASIRAGFDSWSAGVRAATPLGEEIELQVRSLVFRDHRRLRFAGANSSSEGEDASLRVIGRGRWQFDVLAFLQLRNFSNVVISSSRFTKVLDQRKTPSSGLGGKIELRPPVGGGHVLRLGVDYRRAKGQLLEEAFSAFSGALRERRRAGGTNGNLGLFVEDDWRLGNLVVTGGLRADRTRIANGFYRALAPNGGLVAQTIAPTRKNWSLSWRAGAAFAPSEAIKLRAAAYTALRVPTLNELYRPFVVFPVVTMANAGLRNERLEGIEAGFDYAPTPGISFKLTAFDNKVKRAIANVTLAPNLRQRQNLDAISAKGIEGSLLLAIRTFSLRASISASDTKVRGTGSSATLDGNRPPQTPRFSASATFGWKPKAGWEFSAILRHVSAQYEGDRENDVLPAFTTLGGFAKLPLSRAISLVVRAENLTGETVVTRNLAGAIDLGAPRTIWAGLRYAM